MNEFNENISGEALDEILESVVDLVKLSGLSCFILGNEENNTIYSFVFGEYGQAEAALEGLLVLDGEAKVLMGIKLPDEEDEPNYEKYH